MSTPAAAQPAQQPPAGQQQGHGDQALILAIIAALAAGFTIKAIVGRLRRAFHGSGVSQTALRLAVTITVQMPQSPQEGTGAATRWAADQSALRRAAFVLAASRRLQNVIDHARAQNQPLMPALGDAARAEQRYFAQHVAADAGRMAAAARVDGAADQYGDPARQAAARRGMARPAGPDVILLSWNAVRDAGVTPGCLAADGKSFRADRPPVIEGHPAYPGTVHARCRCYPGAPRPGAQILE